MESFVVYRALYGEYGLWIRPKAMFLETVEKDGVSIPRFEYLGIHRLLAKGHGAKCVGRESGKLRHHVDVKRVKPSVRAFDAPRWRLRIPVFRYSARSRAR